MRKIDTMRSKDESGEERSDASEGNKRRADNEIGPLRSGTKKDWRALRYRHTVSEGNFRNVKKRKTRIQ